MVGVQWWRTRDSETVPCDPSAYDCRNGSLREPDLPVEYESRRKREMAGFLHYTICAVDLIAKGVSRDRKYILRED